MAIRKLLKEYLTSWFTKPEFDYDRLLDEINIKESLSLPGKFDWGTALGYYKNDDTEVRTILGDFLYRFKYLGDEQCGRKLSILLKKNLKNNPFERNIDLATTVPVTISGRAFKPMNFILKLLIDDLPGSFKPGLLSKKKIVGQAKDVKGGWRKREVIRGMFKVNDRYDVHDKNILIFDDIYDSGATLNECTRILKNFGANNIYAITLVRTRRGQGL